MITVVRAAAAIDPSVSVRVCVKEQHLKCLMHLHLLGPVVELFADQLNAFRVTERQEVNNLVDPPQKLVPPELSLKRTNQIER